MGLQLIVKNEDFSAISIGKLGLQTSVSSGLVGLFCLSSLLSGPTKNWADGGANAAIVGSPTVEADGVTSSQNSYIDFNIVSAGDRTMAFIIKNNGVDGTHYFSSYAPAPTYGEYLRISGSNINFESNKFSTPQPSLASTIRDELVVATIDDGVGATLRIPRTGASVVKASTNSQILTTEYRTSMASAAGAAASKAMAFAYWNRVLTVEEIGIFYTEMQTQLSELGIATI